MKLGFLPLILAGTAYGQIVSTTGKVDAETKAGYHGRIELSYQTAGGNINYEMKNVEADFRYGHKKHVGILLHNRIFKQNKDKVFADSKLYHLRYRYYPIAGLALEAYFQQNRNVFKALDDRQLFGGGVRKEYGDVALGASILQESEEYTQNLGSTIDNRFSFFLSYTFWPNENIRADIITYYQPRINETSNAHDLFDPKDRRALIEASVSAKLSTKLYYKFTTNISYDQKPPAEYIDKKDSLIKNSLSYEF